MWCSYSKWSKPFYLLIRRRQYLFTSSIHLAAESFRFTCFALFSEASQIRPFKFTPFIIAAIKHAALFFKTLAHLKRLTSIRHASYFFRRNQKKQTCNENQHQFSFSSRNLPVLNLNALYENKFKISCAHCSKSIGNYKVLRTIAPRKHTRLECCPSNNDHGVRVITVIDMQQFEHRSVAGWLAAFRYSFI